MLNKLLQDQIEELLEKDLPNELKPLFEKISASYNYYQDSFDPSRDTQLLKQAKLLKEETDGRLDEQRKAKRLTRHLNVCQRIGLIGSWEADLSQIGHSNIYWSNEVFNVLGYEPGEIIPTFRCFFNAIHPEDRFGIVEKLESLIKIGGSFEIEHRLLTTNGTLKNVLNTLEVFVDEETKEPFKLLGTVQDITDKKRKDNDLTSLNYELKTLFENMQEAFFSVDMRTYTTLQMSHACEEIYGYTVEEFLQKADLWLDLVIEEDKPIVTANYPAMNAGQPFHQQYRILNKQGNIRWVESRINPTLQNGKLVRLDGVTSDITKRKESEIALKENELKFRTLIENCSDGITVANENLDFTFASASMCRLTGNSVDEIVGKSIFGFLPAEDIEVANNLAAILKDNPGVPIAFKGRFLKEDSTYFFHEGFVTNLLHDPIIGGYVCNFHDITERHEAEKALKASNLELQKTNKELDRFVYSVSHDLRAPLASILGALEYAETETEDTMILKYLSLMKGSALKLDGFIVDILNYSRNSRLEIKKEAVDFSELLDDMKNNLKYMGSKDANVDIRVVLNNNHIFYSDTSRLSIIINNLVSNSIRYYNPAIANPFVEVRVDATKSQATLVIKDNGLGIDKKFHDKIFDMFYRLSKKSEGSGLGLYIVKETVEKLQGSFQLQSEPGEGTEFTICLPNNN